MIALVPTKISRLPFFRFSKSVLRAFPFTFPERKPIEIPHQAKVFEKFSANCCARISVGAKTTT